MAPARAPRAAARALGLLLLALLLPLRPADAQGLKRSQDNLLGSSSSYKSLQALQASSQAFKSQFKANRKSACGDKAGSLCASKASIDETAALTVATSPPRFDARDPKDTGGAVLASPVRDQGACFSCTAFAVTGAAEAAVSAALGKDASARKWSVQDLHFCLSKSDGESKSCRSSASSVLDVLKPFVSSPRSLVLEACLPYTAPDAPLDDDLCQTQCSDVDPDLKAGGKFEYVQLNSAWEVQQHIRTWGAAITRLDIYDDFKPFFEKTPGGVYAGPGRGAKFLEGHAVLLVGYDANKGAYLIKNSWGPEFGQGGYAWVSFAGGEKVGIGALADTYGLRFRPTAAAPLPYTYSPGPKPDCVAVALPIGTWLSTIAQQLRLPIRKLLVDNLDTITDLEKPLDPSKPLMVCGAPPAMIARMRKGAPPPPPPPAPKPAPAAGGGAAEESVAPPDDGGAAASAAAVETWPEPAVAAAAPGGECSDSEEPKPVRNLQQASGGADGTMKISWEAPGGGQCVDSYSIEVMALDSGKTQRAKIPLTSGAKTAGGFTFKGTPGQDYLFTVTAENASGRSDVRSLTLAAGSARRRLQRLMRSARR